MCQFAHCHHLPTFCGPPHAGRRRQWHRQQSAAAAAVAVEREGERPKYFEIGPSYPEFNFIAAQHSACEKGPPSSERSTMFATPSTAGTDKSWLRAKKTLPRANRSLERSKSSLWVLPMRPFRNHDKQLHHKEHVLTRMTWSELN